MRSLRDTFVLGLMGSGSPRGVGLAALLGVLAGFVCGWNLLLAVVLLLALLANVHTATLLAWWAIGGVAAWLGAPVTTRLGMLVLDRTPLGATLGRLVDERLIVACELDRYSLVGGLLLAPLVAWPAARLTAGIVRRLAAAGSDDSPPPTVRRGALVQLAALWLWGSRQASPCRAPRRRLRPVRWSLALVAVLAASALHLALVPRVFEQRLLDRLSQANRAQVSAASYKLALSEGRLTMTDLIVPDAAELERDLLRIGRVEADVDVAALWRGRLHVRHLALIDVRGSVARDGLAQATGRRPLRASGLDLEGGSLLADDEIELSAAQVLRDGPEVLARLGWLARVVGALEQLADSSRHDMAGPRRVEEVLQGGAASPLGELGHEEGAVRVGGRPRHASAYSALGRRLPEVWIESLTVTGLSRQWRLGEGATLELFDVATAPALVGRPTQMIVTAPDLGLHLRSELSLAEGPRRHALEFRVYGAPLARWVNPLQDPPRLAVIGGRLNLLGHGWIDRQQVDVLVQASVNELDAQLLGSEPLGGLSATTWNAGLRHTWRLHGEVAVRGRWDDLRLAYRPGQLARHFKHELRASGQHRLVQAIEAELAAGRHLAVGSNSLMLEGTSNETPLPQIEVSLDRPGVAPPGGAAEAIATDDPPPRPPDELATDVHVAGEGDTHGTAGHGTAGQGTAGHGTAGLGTAGLGTAGQASSGTLAPVARDHNPLRPATRADAAHPSDPPDTSPPLGWDTDPLAGTTPAADIAGAPDADLATPGAADAGSAASDAVLADRHAVDAGAPADSASDAVVPRGTPSDGSRTLHLPAVANGAAAAAAAGPAGDRPLVATARPPEYSAADDVLPGPIELERGYGPLGHGPGRPQPAAGDSRGGRALRGFGRSALARWNAPQGQRRGDVVRSLRSSEVADDGEPGFWQRSAETLTGRLTWVWPWGREADEFDVAPQLAADPGTVETAPAGPPVGGETVVGSETTAGGGPIARAPASAPAAPTWGDMPPALEAAPAETPRHAHRNDAAPRGDTWYERLWR